MVYLLCHRDRRVRFSLWDVSSIKLFKKRVDVDGKNIILASMRPVFLSQFYSSLTCDLEQVISLSRSHLFHLQNIRLEMKIQFRFQSSQALLFPLTSRSDHRNWILVLVLPPTCGLTQASCSGSSFPYVAVIYEGYSWALAFKWLVEHILKEMLGISNVVYLYVASVTRRDRTQLNPLVMTQRSQLNRDFPLSHLGVFVPLGLWRCLSLSPQSRTWDCHSVQFLCLVPLAVNCHFLSCWLPGKYR